MAADAASAAHEAPQDSPSPATHEQEHAPPDAALDSDEAVAMARAIEGSAFSTWKESLAQELARESQALTARIHALQSAFDDTSVFIRGDVAWRKQLEAFHDTVNDALATQLRGLAHTLAQNATALAQSLSESFAHKDAQAKRAVAWQTQMYEDKLRRTRTSLKKEIDRFALLEKCLRQEQAVQAQAMYDARVQALTAEYDAKEAVLHALVRELRSSHSAMELGNAQLMDALRTARSDAERYKKMLSRHVQSSSNSSSSASSGSPRKSTMKSPTRLGAPASSTSASGSSTNIADVYIQSLKQSVTAANETIESLKKQVADATAERDASLRKLRQTEDAASATAAELAKVTQLLSESHTALVASKRATEQVERERLLWHERFHELAFRTESQGAELRAAEELCDATRAYVASLEAQVQALAGASPSDERPDESALALKLRYDFEKRYSEQLNVRVSHERKRVLARIEALCAKQQQQQTDTEASAPLTRRVSRALSQRTCGRMKVPYRVVHKIVSDAYDDLGLSDWSTTDLDALHGQITTLQAQLAAQMQRTAQLDAIVETQAMVLAKADLLQQEKEFLLAELTDKYKALRAAHDMARQLVSDGPESTTADAAVRGEEVPLTVYGYPQRLELKTLRTRPVSAAPALVSSTACTHDGDDRVRDDGGALSRPDPQHQRGAAMRKARTGRPMSSAGPVPQHRRSRSRPVPMSPGAKPFLAAGASSSAAVAMMTEPPPLQQVEHIRSVLKSELLQLSPLENQLDDGAHVGPDGILQIIQRRRSRR